VRDVAGLHKVRLPVFATGVTPTAGPHLGVGDLDLTLEINGVTIRPGDTIMGDVNGVLVSPGTIADGVLEQACKTAVSNGRSRGEVMAGKPLLEVPAVRAYLHTLFPEG
jgi:regulator of RNase E activity RraA